MRSGGAKDRFHRIGLLDSGRETLGPALIACTESDVGAELHPVGIISLWAARSYRNRRAASLRYWGAGFSRNRRRLARNQHRSTTAATIGLRRGRPCAVHGAGRKDG